MVTENEIIGMATKNEIIGWIIIIVLLLCILVKLASSKGSSNPSLKIKRSARKAAFRRSDGKTLFRRKVKRMKRGGQYRV